MTTAKDLVDAIQSGKSATIQATFNSLMTEKIQDGIETYRQAVIDNTFNPELDEVAYDTRTLDDKKKKQPVIARGVKGMKSTPFEKKFPSMAHYEKWADSEASGNHEVHDVRLHESEDDLEEDYQSIDELSGATLGSYIQKAHKDRRKKFDHEKELDADPKVKADTEKQHSLILSRDYKKDGSSKHRATIDKLYKTVNDRKKKLDPGYPKSGSMGALSRNRGIEKAVKRLANGTKLSEEFDLSEYTLDEIQEFIVSEEFESLDELSKTTLKSYYKKASADRSKAQTTAQKYSDKATTAGIKTSTNTQKYKDLKSKADAAGDKMVKRTNGTDAAGKRLGYFESEEVDESGEVESVDELSKKTLASYTKNAAISAVVGKEKADASTSAMNQRLSSGDARGAEYHASKANSANRKVGKRIVGIVKATDKLAKD